MSLRAEKAAEAMLTFIQTSALTTMEQALCVSVVSGLIRAMSRAAELSGKERADKVATVCAGAVRVTIDHLETDDA